MRTSYNTGIMPGYYISSMYGMNWSKAEQYRNHKDRVFKETHDFIRIANVQREKIEHAIKRGARILPCLR